MGIVETRALDMRTPAARKAVKADLGRAGGRLIVVTSPDMGRADLVLKAAIRRLEASHTIVLAEPVATRPLPAGSGMIVTRNGFARLERDGEIVLGWSGNGRSYGYETTLLERLARGETLVCALPAGQQLETAARSLWRDVKVISLASGTQTLRAGLSPRMAFARTACSAAHARLEKLLSENSDERIVDLGCLASAVKALSTAIQALLPVEQRRGVALSDTAGIPVHPVLPAPARTPAPRKLRSGKSRHRPPAKRADKTQVRATLPT